MADTYILRDADAGAWFVYSRKQHGALSDTPTALVVGEPFATSACQREGWWRCGVKPDALRWDMPDRERTVEWRLPEGVTLPDFPPDMTPEERREFTATDDRDCGPLSLYERITVTEPQDPIVVDLSGAVVLRSQGPDDVQVPDGMTWKAKLPFELSERTEYLWLFPGHLSDVRDALKKRLEAMPGIKSAYNHSPFKVCPKLGPSVELRLGSQIKGDNLADAVAKFERWADTIAAEVGAYRQPCRTCNGQGFVESVVEASDMTPEEQRDRLIVGLRVILAEIDESKAGQPEALGAPRTLRDFHYIVASLRDAAEGALRDIEEDA